MDEDNQKLAYEALFIFAGMWAFGGSVGGGQDDEKDQKEFSSMWRSYSKGIKLPEAGLCFDYFFDAAKLTWIHWNTCIPNYTPVTLDETPFSKIYVSTLHTTKLKYLLSVHVNRFQSVLFIGNAGTGKTAVTNEYLSTSRTEDIEHRSISFNSFTDSISL